CGHDAGQSGPSEADRPPARRRQRRAESAARRMARLARGRFEPLTLEEISMSLTTSVDLSSCGPSQLWAALPADTRQAAARALYAHDWGNAPTRREADFAIIQGMRFRETAVRQLPIDKRAGYLARSIRPNDSLASSLLLALHLESRRPML